MQEMSSIKSSEIFPKTFVFVMSALITFSTGVSVQLQAIKHSIPLETAS